MIRIVLMILLTSLVSVSQAQKKIASHIHRYVPTKGIVCYASEEVNHHHVPAKKRTKANKNPLQIIPQYAANVPREVQDLIDNGVIPILSEAYSSTQPIRAAIFWRNDLGEGALAGASPTTYFRNLPASLEYGSLPLTNVWYPVALAEKLVDQQLNDPGDPDIRVTINSEADWYMAYNNPGGVGNKYDLLSTLLHEFYHGMGFLGAFVNVTGDNGSVGTNGAVGAYTHNVLNTDGFFIRDFNSGTSQLKEQLTSNTLVYRINNDETRQPKIYAPRTWEPGSSFSHVDEFTFNNTESALMTPSSARGEIERSGGVADEIMYDMGWAYTSILHTPGEPKENVDDPYDVTVRVLSDEDLLDGIVYMHYSADEFANTTVLPMNDDSNGEYSAQIPATGEEQVISYYFSTKDKNDKEYVAPGEAPTYSYTHVFAIDDSIPTISHTDILSVKNVDASFDVIADITDFFTGVDTAYVEYRVNGGDVSTVGMTLMALDSFSPPVYVGEVALPAELGTSDMIEYRIMAIDKSQAANQAQYPEDGSYRIVSVEEVAASVDKYYNSFFEQEADFVLDGFTQERLNGWGTEALHTEHPYTNAGEDNAINYIAELQIPIRIAEVDPLLIFEEVVLVENGDAGVPFGTTEFWDYVIVEGKKLGTSEWLPFLEGYDCRANPVWLNTYLGGIAQGQQNSIAIGTEAMLRKRTIDMTKSGHFVAGDEVLIRFRMLSDPFAVGWGWAIDNLSIQDATTAVEDYVIDDGYSITPNPASDKITIALSLEQSSPQAQISIIDMLGQVYMTTPLRTKSKRVSKDIDISALPTGVYFVQIAFSDEDVISQKIVKSE